MPPAPDPFRSGPPPRPGETPSPRPVPTGPPPRPWQRPTGNCPVPGRPGWRGCWSAHRGWRTMPAPRHVRPPSGPESRPAVRGDRRPRARLRSGSRAQPRPPVRPPQHIPRVAALPTVALTALMLDRNWPILTCSSSIATRASPADSSASSARSAARPRRRSLRSRNAVPAGERQSRAERLWTDSATPRVPVPTSRNSSTTWYSWATAASRRRSCCSSPKRRSRAVPTAGHNTSGSMTGSGRVPPTSPWTTGVPPWGSVMPVLPPCTAPVSAGHSPFSPAALDARQSRRAPRGCQGLVGISPEQSVRCGGPHRGAGHDRGRCPAVVGHGIHPAAPARLSP
ncbi:hypothetical protein ACFFX0_19460 [Citricoccus parietis]|uniref:Basic proline-rich protein n=1 Tax=Citricoccus parietis TaxID=592307 RepID=A0ABV5G2V5_9MICC